MTSPRAFVAILVSLALHGVLLAAVVSGLISAPPRPPAEREPMTVVLLEPPRAEPPSLPAAPPPAPPPSPAKPPPEKKKAPSKPKPKPVAPPAQPLARAPKEIPAPAAAAPSLPAQADAAPAAPAPAAAPPAPPAPPAPSVKTGVSISASYRASNRQPVQPPMSVRYGEHGTVMLRVQVKADGTAGAVEIRTSSGFALLDEAARTAVQTWRFNPATVDGKPVQEWYVVPVTFTLKN